MRKRGQGERESGKMEGEEREGGRTVDEGGRIQMGVEEKSR